MRHDNSKILGFGLLALAAVLAMKGKKAPGVGAVTKNMPTIDAEHQQRVNEVFEMLKDKYDFIREDASATTTSKYYTFMEGKGVFFIRKADHVSKKLNRFNTEKRIFTEIDLVKLTESQSAQDAFMEAVAYINETKGKAESLGLRGKVSHLVRLDKRIEPDIE